MRPPIYKTDRFELRPYQEEDEDVFVEIALDPFSVNFMGGASGVESKERALFKKVMKIYEDGESARWFWIWGVYEDGILGGHLELKSTSYTGEKELEIVYMVHPKMRRKGMMKEVLNFLKEQQFVWDIQLIATINPKNKASLNLLEKIGIERKEMLKEDEEEFWKIWMEK